VSNRGIGRGRLFMGNLILFAAVIAAATGMFLSPHGQSSAQGTEHVRLTVVTLIRNSAIGTILLSALAVWLLYPARRPQRPIRDWVIAAVLAVLIVSSLYELVWLRTAVLG
jgi:magnesium-transporting ATPase (P-type)